MTIKCPECGKELENLSKPCPNCGETVNEPYTQWVIGWRYRFGRDGYPQDTGLAEFWLQQGMYHGDTKASNELFLLYAHKDRNFLKNMEQEAASGDVQTQRNVGFLYEIMHGVKNNYDFAMNWLENAAQQGDSIAQRELAWLLFKGTIPGKLNLYDSLKWFMASEKEDHAKEDSESSSVRKKLCSGYQYLIGKLNALNTEEAGKVLNQMEPIDDKNLEKDWRYYFDCYKKAEEILIREAADSADIQNIVGGLYEMGTVFPKNYDKAIEWYSKSADSGNVEGTYSLGKLLYSRHRLEDSDFRASVEQKEKNASDEKKGIKLIKEAAKAGYPKAQREFARIQDIEREINSFFSH